MMTTIDSAQFVVRGTRLIPIAAYTPPTGWRRWWRSGASAGTWQACLSTAGPSYRRYQPSETKASFGIGTLYEGVFDRYYDER
jgi:hypothetical protein